jgi:hypothetical protein
MRSPGNWGIGDSSRDTPFTEMGICNDRGKAGGTDPGELARSRDAREPAQEFYSIGMLGIRARRTVGDAVNKTAARSWGRKELAPHTGRI